MQTSCFNHPDIPSTHVCSRCERNFCFDCIDIVKGRYVCYECDAEAKKQAADARAAMPPAPVDYVARTKQEPLLLVRLVRAVAWALAFAVIGQLIWEKLIFYLHVQFFAINVVIGFFIGVGARIGLTKGKWLAAIVAGAVALLAVFAGYYLLTLDYASGLVGGMHHAIRLVNFHIYSSFLCALGIMQWVYASLEVGAAVVTARVTAPFKSEESGSGGQRA
jgi:hypothetical protein